MKPTQPTPTAPVDRRRSRRGSVIIFVLGVIFLTAFLLTKLIDRSGGELLAEAKASSRAALREEAYNVLDATLAVLASVNATDGGLYAPGQGWADPLTWVKGIPAAGYQAHVDFADESGLLSLPHVDDTTLQRYLEGIGCASADAEKLVDALNVWTKRDYSARTTEADPQQYESGPLPYAPPQRALRSWEELRAIRVTRELFFDEQGNWNELGGRFRADATLHNIARANLNATRTPVLTALGLDSTQTGQIERNRADPHALPFFRTAAEASGAWGADLTAVNAGTTVLCLRVRITVSQGGRVFRLEAVVTPGTAPAAPAAPPPPPPNTPAGSAAAAPETIPAVRNWTRNRIDYPFVILELREDSGP